MNRQNKQRPYKNSIKRRISVAYTSIYLIICFVIIVVFFACYIIYNGLKYSQTSDLAAGDVATLIANSDAENLSELRYDKVFYEKIFELNSKYNSERIYLYNTKYELITSTSPETDINYYSSSENVLFAVFPQLSEIKNGFYISESEAEAGGETLRTVVFFNVEDRIDDLLIIAVMLLITMAVGFALFAVIGSSRTHTILAPIERITNVAKRINGDNLALRIDESQAQYELEELVKTINRMMDRIQSSYNKQKRFVSDVSHELRTPISVISGYGNMLKRWGSEDEEILAESVDAIINEADMMNDLIEKLLFLARHDNETLRFEFEEVNFSGLLAETVKDYNLVHTDFNFRLDIEEGISAQIDAMRMKQLCRILVDNAVKYSQDDKTIDISLKKAGSEIILSIKDYGIGISKSDLPNIFDRFFRADVSRARATGGYGLGLPMAKIIVLGHKGSVTVRSKLNVGSEFIVRIETPGFPNTDEMIPVQF